MKLGIGVRRKLATVRRSLSLTVLGTVASVGMLLAMGDSSEASVAAMGGSARLASSATCFTSSNGRITNTCATSQEWCVAPYITSSGNKSVVLTSYMPTGGTYSCIAKSADKFGTTITSTGTLSFTTTLADTEWSLGTVNVSASTGVAYVCCTMSQNSRLNTVQLN